MILLITTYVIYTVFRKKPTHIFDYNSSIFWLIFIARQHTAADAQYWYSNSVRLSVCPWHAGIVW